VAQLAPAEAETAKAIQAHQLLEPLTQVEVVAVVIVPASQQAERQVVLVLLLFVILIVMKQQQALQVLQQSLLQVDIEYTLGLVQDR
jgi:hypothetical protein